MTWMRAPLFFAAILVHLSPPSSSACDTVFPGDVWSRVEAPDQAGWSSAGLDAAKKYSDSIATDAVMLVYGGEVLAEWGETARRFNVHSIRKSLLSALYGIHVAEGRIDLSKTLAELGIDDNEPSLTPVEKQATVRHLLQARSGVYHPALYETPRMKAARPERGRHAPGEFWYYNNWDFNVLGSIFERRTKSSLFREFQARVAEPIGMEDFRLEDCEYVTGPDSVYPAYTFRMSARDLARFGLLYLRGGEWRGRRIVPAEWIRESLTTYSDAGDRGAYGYMWWIASEGRHLPGVQLPDGAFSARGAGGHYVLVAPSFDLVLVHRVDTDVEGRAVTAEEFGEFVRLVLESRTSRAP